MLREEGGQEEAVLRGPKEPRSFLRGSDGEGGQDTMEKNQETLSHLLWTLLALKLTFPFCGDNLAQVEAAVAAMRGDDLKGGCYVDTLTI